MKKTLLLLSFAVVMMMTGCGKNNGSDIDPTKMYGDIMFWTDVSSNHSEISVTFRNVTRRITKSYSVKPDCGAAGCVTFEEVPIGTYSFYATDNLGSWDGEVTVYYNQCSSMKLYADFKDAVEDDSSQSACRIDFKN